MFLNIITQAAQMLELGTGLHNRNKKLHQVWLSNFILGNENKLEMGIPFPKVSLVGPSYYKDNHITELEYHKKNML